MFPPFIEFTEVNTNFNWYHVRFKRCDFTSSAAGPHRHWVGHQCRRSAAAVSTLAVPLRLSQRVRPECGSGGPSAGSPHPGVEH